MPKLDELVLRRQAELGSLLAEAEHHLEQAEDAQQPTRERARSLARATASVNDAEKVLRAAGIWPD